MVSYLMEAQDGQAVLFMVNNKGKLIMHLTGYAKEYDCTKLMASGLTPDHTKNMICRAATVLGKEV